MAPATDITVSRAQVDLLSARVVKDYMDQEPALKRSLPSLGELRRSSAEFQHRAIGSLMHRVSRLKLREVFLGDAGQTQIKIPYLEGGAGTPLVFLHGFADQKETWSILAPRLADRHRVLLPDLPGYGDATLVGPDEATLEAQAEHLRGFLDRVGVYGPAHLCGNSMGGGVALEFAKRYPERVASLSLLSTMGPTRTPSDLQGLMEQSLCPLLPKTLDDYEEMLSFVFAKRPPLPRVFWRHLANRAAERHEHHSSIFYHIAEISPDWGERIEPLPHRTLFLHGRQDRVIHWSTSQALAGLMPSSTLLLMDGVGHAPQWEAPRRTLSALRNFLSMV